MPITFVFEEFEIKFQNFQEIALIFRYVAPPRSIQNIGSCARGGCSPCHVRRDGHHSQKTSDSSRRMGLVVFDRSDLHAPKYTSLPARQETKPAWRR
jgi:hypothetical protein